MPEKSVEGRLAENLAVFTSEASDAALEAAAGDVRGLFCSCSGCNSACSNDSQ